MNAKRKASDHEGDFGRVLPTHPQYHNLAVRACRVDANHLKSVPETHRLYREIAKRVLKMHGLALRWVSPSCPHFGELARIAVCSKPFSIEFVPSKRADYSTLARVACEHDGAALMVVDQAFRDGRIAEIAVYHTPEAIGFVRSNSTNYATLARRAVEADPEALLYVDRSHSVYTELIKDAPEQVECDQDLDERGEDFGYFYAWWEQAPPPAPAQPRRAAPLRTTRLPRPPPQPAHPARPAPSDGPATKRPPPRPRAPATLKEPKREAPDRMHQQVSGAGLFEMIVERDCDAEAACASASGVQLTQVVHSRTRNRALRVPGAGVFETVWETS